MKSLFSQDYDADHPDIDLLRLRNYTIGKKLKDEEIIGPQGLTRLTELIGAMVPFVSYGSSHPKTDTTQAPLSP